MITFEFTSGNGIEKLIEKYNRDLPLKKIAEIVQTDIISDTKKRGWRRIEKTIKRKSVDKNTEEIFFDGKDSNISSFLNSGTKRHFIAPRKKKALSWVSAGGRFFSKGHFVKGIKATNFLIVSNVARTKIKEFIKSFYK